MFNTFTTLLEGLRAAGLDSQLLQSAEDVLSSLNISQRFQHDVV